MSCSAVKAAGKEEEREMSEVIGFVFPSQCYV